MINRGLMTRFAVVIAVTMSAAACDVGSVLEHSATGDGGGSGSNCENLVATPPPDHPHTAPVDAAKPTNAGQGCMTAAGCHNAGLGLGAAAPEYSWAGTVFKDAAGTMPYAGATILVTMGGVTKKLIAGDTGNFQITPALFAGPDTGTPGNAIGSVCPSATPMVGTLITGNGNCGAAGTCHGPGGSQGPIHIP
jgi:hypothetical protein